VRGNSASWSLLAGEEVGPGEPNSLKVKACLLGAGADPSPVGRALDADGRSMEPGWAGLGFGGRVLASTRCVDRAGFLEAPPDSERAVGDLSCDPVAARATGPQKVV